MQRKESKRKICSIPARAPLLAVVVLSACGNLPDMETGGRAYKNQDYATARSNYEQLADFGIPRAKIELGKMYLYGRGADADPQKALALFEDAKTQGDPTSVRLIPKAQSQLGMLAFKDNSPISPEQGLELLQQAAATGDPGALFNLGYAYEKGFGVPVSGQMADQYYQQAAAQNYPRADFQRGRMYQNGELIPKNMNMAIRLYETAGQKGYARGYLELGKIYEKGEGLPADYKRAKNYYALAKENGLPTDKDLRRSGGKSG